MRLAHKKLNLREINIYNKIIRNHTFGPLGPLLQRGVLVVLQSAQTLIVLLLLLLFEEEPVL